MRKKIYYLFALVMSLFVFTACGSDAKELAFNDYINAWEAKDYETMYTLLSKDSKTQISQEEFMGRYQVIYDAIDANDIQITILEEDNHTDTDSIRFRLTMETSIAPLEFDDYEMTLVEETQEEKEGYFVNWDESLIFPQMAADDKVRIETITAQRGEIFDQADQPLAVNGLRYQIGIHPAQFDEADISQLADRLDIDADDIKEELDENIDPDLFVPIVKISTDDKDLVRDLLAIEGVLSQEIKDRLYPAGEAFGTLLGYINPITAEELEESDPMIYHSNSLIGKAGLEKVYEADLRAIDGKELYISKIEADEEVKRISLAEKEAQDGQNLQLTIDANLQNKIYEQVEEDVGTASAIDPFTGDLLALVSYPSYDPNIYRTYTPNSLRDKWEAMEASPFENRFNKVYSPGSVFKLITGAIALENEVTSPDEKLSIEGRSWQKDSSWGDYQINRVSQQLNQVNLKEAFVYSDNIYFAQQALNIGPDRFLEGAKAFGFDEELPMDYPFAASQITNDGQIESDILLADTGYGQGEILMSSLHLALIYSSLVNDGQMMQPTLTQGEAKLWKENLYSDDHRQVLLDSLIAVIEDPNGTGQAAQIEGIKLAGKTGTAEFKQSQTADGKENGWFVAMDVQEPQIVLSMMIENVEKRGGSQYPLEKVHNVLADYLQE